MYRARLSCEHQPDAGTTIQRFGQADKTTCERNDFQFAPPAATVLRSKNGRSRAREPGPWEAPNRLGLGRHGCIEYGLRQGRGGGYGRTLRGTITVAQTMPKRHAVNHGSSFRGITRLRPSRLPDRLCPISTKLSTTVP